MTGRPHKKCGQTDQVLHLGCATACTLLPNTGPKPFCLLRLLRVSFNILGECNCKAQWQANDLLTGCAFSGEYISWKSRGVSKLEKFVKHASYLGGVLFGAVIPGKITQSLRKRVCMLFLCLSAPQVVYLWPRTCRSSMTGGSRLWRAVPLARGIWCALGRIQALPYCCWQTGFPHLLIRRIWGFSSRYASKWSA